MFYILSTIRMSFSNLKANAMRTFLTMLGVIIGISSIIAFMTIGRGVTDSVVNQLAGLGGNRVSVSIDNRLTKPGFTEEDLARYDALPGVIGVSPSLSSYKILTLTPELTSSKYDSVHTTARLVMGVNDYYFSSYNKDAGMLYGRSITVDDVTYSTNVCVLGYDLWQKLYGNYNPVGEIIKIENTECVVIGVMNKLVGMDVTGNNSVIVPYTMAVRTLKMGLPYRFDALLDSGADTNEIILSIDQLTAEILNCSDGSAYSIVNQEEIMDIVLTITDLVLGMLAGISAIALVVGGIGIMNMMLVTVTERTAEIGLRKALGAKPSVILLQFLIEATIISLTGGVIGVLLGLGISYIASLIIGYTFAYSMVTVLVAVLFSLVVGLFFGLLPARRAAKLNPIDALRSK